MPHWEEDSKKPKKEFTIWYCVQRTHCVQTPLVLVLVISMLVHIPLYRHFKHTHGVLHCYLTTHCTVIHHYRRVQLVLWMSAQHAHCVRMQQCLYVLSTLLYTTVAEFSSLAVYVCSSSRCV